MLTRATLLCVLMGAMFAIASPAQAVDCTVTPLPAGCPGGAVTTVDSGEPIATPTNTSAYQAAAGDSSVSGEVSAGGSAPSGYGTLSKTTADAGSTVEVGSGGMLCTTTCATNAEGEPILAGQTTEPATTTLYRSSASGGNVTAMASRGCRQEWVQRTSRTLFGGVFYRLRLNVRWCYNGRRVSDVDKWVSFLDPAATAYYRGIIARRDNYFCIAYCSNRSTQLTGNYGFRQAQVENCLFRYGCIRVEYPWLKAWLYGSGSWRYDSGGT